MCMICLSKENIFQVFSSAELLRTIFQRTNISHLNGFGFGVCVCVCMLLHIGWLSVCVHEVYEGDSAGDSSSVSVSSALTHYAFVANKSIFS